MGRTKSKGKTVVKTPCEVKSKAADKTASPSSKERTPVRPLSDSLIERLSQLVNLEDIAEHGFPKETWISLSLEEKVNLPAFISSKYRHSDGTKADRARNNEMKRIVHNQIMKYEKYAKRKFYSTNKKKIKNAQIKDSTLTGQGAVDLIWNELNDTEKNTWYNEHTASVATLDDKI